MKIAPGTQVKVGVHERADGSPGFVVKVTVEQAPEPKIVRIPVPDRGEADALAASIVEFVELGLPVEALLGEGDVPLPGT